MIQIQNKQQFTKAIERAKKERMLVSMLRFRDYSVLNRSNGRRYVVMFEVVDGKKFGTCSCEAGSPMRGNHLPMVCEHLLAALTVHTALMAQRNGH
ncbi:MAG: hypothetical protein M3R15_04770 [Acidobacteriota bacterium]|nr:hypothetical protein [Acidobacteriota bacterium]